jgi:hypothetical protein
MIKIKRVIFISLLFAIAYLFGAYQTVLAKCVVQQETVKVGNNIRQQVTETCDDNQKYDVGKIGFSGKLELFRQHPDFPGTFVHNRTICRWFLDNQFVNNDITNYQGIICQVGDNWTVVDKF